MIEIWYELFYVILGVDLDKRFNLLLFGVEVCFWDDVKGVFLIFELMMFFVFDIVFVFCFILIILDLFMVLLIGLEEDCEFVICNLGIVVKGIVKNLDFFY